MITMKAKYNGWCTDCGYTIWKGEKIRYSGTPKHMNCESARFDGNKRYHIKEWKAKNDG